MTHVFVLLSEIVTSSLTAPIGLAVIFVIAFTGELGVSPPATLEAAFVLVGLRLAHGSLSGLVLFPVVVAAAIAGTTLAMWLSSRGIRLFSRFARPPAWAENSGFLKRLPNSSAGRIAVIRQLPGAQLPLTVLWVATRGRRRPFLTGVSASVVIHWGAVAVIGAMSGRLPGAEGHAFAIGYMVSLVLSGIILVSPSLRAGMLRGMVRRGMKFLNRFRIDSRSVEARGDEVPPAQEPWQLWAGRIRRWVAFLFIATVAIVVAMHATRPPTLEPFRVPSDLHRTTGIWGITWPLSFQVYHLFLVVMFVNAATLWRGITKIRATRWWQICVSSSLIGGAFALATFLYFALQLESDRALLTRLDLETAFLASIYAAVWLLTDIVAMVVCLTASLPKNSPALDPVREQSIEPDRWTE